MILIRERPPGLIQHVLTVLFFWSWVLASTFVSDFFRASILLRGFLGICLELPAAPLLPVQKRDAQHMFSQHRGTDADLQPLQQTAKKWVFPHKHSHSYRKRTFSCRKMLSLEHALSYRQMLFLQKNVFFWGGGAHGRKPQEIAGGFQGSRIKNASQLSQDTCMYPEASNTHTHTHTHTLISEPNFRPPATCVFQLNTGKLT